MQAQSGPLTQFGRPEDGAWDPSNPGRYYFITTGTPTQPTRLWAMDYYDIEHPELGGTIKVLVEGVFSNSDPNSALPLMLDNMTVTESGLVIMQEDPGNNPRLAKVWMYDPHADNGVDPQRPYRDRAPRPGRVSRRGSIRLPRVAHSTRTRNPPAWST